MIKLSRPNATNSSDGGPLPFFARLMHTSPPTLLTVVLLIAALTRLPLLTRTSFWYDEAASWDQSRGSLTELFTKVVADNYPPLHNLVLWVTIEIFGDSEKALRFPSLIAGLLAIWLLFKLGEAVADAHVGLAAATLLALSPFHVWYSAEARMYALMAALGLCFLLALVSLLKQPGRARLLLTALATAGFLYTHVYASFSVLGTALALLGPLIFGARHTRQTAGMGLLAIAAGTALFTPWGFVLLKRSQAVAEDGFWIANPSPEFLWDLVQSLGGNGALFLFFCVLAACAVSRYRKAQNPVALAVLTGFSIAPALIGYGLSKTVEPILFDRYLIAALPPLLLLAVIGAKAMVPRGGPLLLVVIALTLSVAPLNDTVLEKLKPQFREAAFLYFENRTGPGEPIYVFNDQSRLALTYYLEGIAPIRTLNQLQLPKDPSPAQDIWVLASHMNETNWTALQSELSGDWNIEFRWSGFGWGASGLTLVRLEPKAG